jgi:hypothetical protein
MFVDFPGQTVPIHHRETETVVIHGSRRPTSLSSQLQPSSRSTGAPPAAKLPHVGAPRGMPAGRRLPLTGRRPAPQLLTSPPTTRRAAPDGAPGAARASERAPRCPRPQLSSAPVVRAVGRSGARCSHACCWG